MSGESSKYYYFIENNWGVAIQVLDFISDGEKESDGKTRISPRNAVLTWRLVQY